MPAQKVKLRPGEPAFRPDQQPGRQQAGRPGQGGDAWRALPFGRFYLNSLAFSLAVVVGQVTTSALAAYAFARLRFPGPGSGRIAAGPATVLCGREAEQGRSDTTLDGGGAAGDGPILPDSHQEPPNRFGVHPFRTKADRVESRHGRAPGAQHHRVTGGVLARRRGQT